MSDHEAPVLDGILPADAYVLHPRVATSQYTAWPSRETLDGGQAPVYSTVWLRRPVEAIRVHRFGEHARSAAVASGNPIRDAWFAIGVDVIATRSEYIDRHAIPFASIGGKRHTFAFQDDWLLPVGTLANVGRAASIRGFGAGGGYQLEVLQWPDGAPPRNARMPIRGYWGDRAGNA